MHHAALLGIAVRLVGRDDARDIVHDSFLVALRSIGDLRDDSSFVPWLKSIVKTQALMHLRKTRRNVEWDEECTPGEPSPALAHRTLEEAATRDWIWSSLEKLSEPLRLTALLRYFSNDNSYERIAEVLGVPVGTVRSRINQVRTKLTDGLLADAGGVHGDMHILQTKSQDHFAEALARANRGSLDCYASNWSTDVVASSSGGETIRRKEPLLASLYEDTIDCGVRLEIDRVVSSAHITVLEARFINPPEAPNHCPARTTQIFFHPGGVTERILFAF
jgi:RNA polymerase sigma-70 factor (ECF subfamily)